MSMELTATTHVGGDKIKRYGWTVQDAPGEMRLLHKDTLQIHPAYQRDLVAQKVSEISAAWSWVALGALVVGERGGEFWVIDGQHRAAAAKRRSDITHLPCVVFKTTDVKQEARGFLTIQTMRKPVSAVAKQKAMVTAGDEVAAFVQQTVEALSLQIRQTAAKAGELKCVGWCLKRAADDRQTFVKVLTLGAELCAKDNMPIAERLLEGLWVLNDRCGDGLADPRFLKRVHERGSRALLDAANKAAAYYASGGGRIWAQGMLGEMNKGLQERRRFTMDGVEA
jgi:hypothetical protein